MQMLYRWATPKGGSGCGSRPSTGPAGDGVASHLGCLKMKQEVKIRECSCATIGYELHGLPRAEVPDKRAPQCTPQNHQRDSVIILRFIWGGRP